MRKIIGGLLYDTDSAKKIAEYTLDDGTARGDFRWYEEALYLKKTGEFFLWGKGGPLTAYAERKADGSTGGEKIFPISESTAREWAESTQDTETYLKIFEAKEEELFYINCGLTKEAKEALDALREESGGTIAEVISSLVLEKVKGKK